MAAGRQREDERRQAWVIAPAVCLARRMLSGASCGMAVAALLVYILWLSQKSTDPNLVFVVDWLHM